MSSIYITKQGETVDLVCWRHYGRTAGVTEAVFAANAGLADLGAILPMGTKILLPVLEVKQTAKPLISLWE